MGALGEGYLQLIDADTLMDLAREEDLVMRLERRPGHYLVKGRAMVTVWPGERVTDELVEQVNAAFVFGNQRTAAQDIEFSFQQLVEIAVRALSPGINDPFTAIACVDRLGSGLCRLARCQMPSDFRFDTEGRLRLEAHGTSFAGIVDTSFNQIRQCARSNPAVAIRLLEAITQIAAHVQHPRDVACLRRHAGMIVRAARAAVPEPDDVHAVEQRHAEAVKALCGLPD